VVQVGAFSSAATAQKMVDQLRAAGYKAYVSPVTRSGKTLQRVRVGPEAERARADGLAASLKGRGLPATVVAND
jgi:DedD protein